MNKKKAQASRKDDHDPNTNEPVDIEDFAGELTITSADTDTNIEESLSPEVRASILQDIESKNTDDSSVTTFPLTRTFIHCDPTGRELAHVSVTATVTLTRVNGVTLTLDEIQRRFRRHFYLSFKGGKVGSKELSTMVSQPSSSPRPRRTMSPEHKQKLQEARQRRRGNESGEMKHDDVDPETINLSKVLLLGLSYEWCGKSACLAGCGITTIEPASWSLAIRYLLDTKQVEARGEKRGREYRHVKSVKATTAATATKGKTK